MTWVQFCALYSDFQSLIIKALFALHSLNIEQTQVLILNRELCTTEQQKVRQNHSCTLRNNLRNYQSILLYNLQNFLAFKALRSMDLIIWTRLAKPNQSYSI